MWYRGLPSFLCAVCLLQNIENLILSRLCVHIKSLINIKLGHATSNAGTLNTMIDDSKLNTERDVQMASKYEFKETKYLLLSSVVSQCLI